MRVSIVGSDDGYSGLYIDGRLVHSGHGISVGQAFEYMLERQEEIFKDNESLKDLVHALKLDLDWTYLNEWQNEHAEKVGGFPEWEKDLEKPW